MILKIKKIGRSKTEYLYNHCIVLYSYKTPVAFKRLETGVIVKTDRRYSQTTTRHITQWASGAKTVEVPDQQFQFIMKELVNS